MSELPTGAKPRAHMIDPKPRMTTTPDELGIRLQTAREAAGMTQKVVSDHLGIPRSSVAQYEAGRRNVTGLELDRLARLFGKPVAEFFARVTADPMSTLLRASAEVARDGALEQRLRTSWRLCREMARLERELGMTRRAVMLVRYELEVPRSKRDAVRQGREVAMLERKRLELGASPVWELPELLVSQGLRISEEALPDGLSGALLASDEVGPLILVDAHYPRTRRLFSYAHEYAHVLLDRARGAIVSRTSDRDDLLEVRANSFAAHLLMPEAGVLAFLESVGKGDVGRQLQLVFDPEPSSVSERITASKLYTTGSQVLQVHDVVRLAHLFGVSYSAAVYQLTNLSLLTRSACEELLLREVEARRLAKILGADDRDEPNGQRLGAQLLALGFEAYRREIISRRKLLELACEAGYDSDAVVAALSEDGIDEEPVPARIEE